MPANATRPGHRGDGRAAEGDQVTAPIASENIRDRTVEQAASWYAANRDACPHPVIPHLRLRFGLTAAEAIDAQRRAVR